MNTFMNKKLYHKLQTLFNNFLFQGNQNLSGPLPSFMPAKEQLKGLEKNFGNMLCGHDTDMTVT
jgi:hypothetical protein